MGSDLPKVVHEAAGKPLVRWVVDALRAAGIGEVIVVVGHRAELVEACLADVPGLTFAIQRQQRGTGDAVAAAAEGIEARLTADRRRPVVIVCGDSPMLRPGSVRGLLERFAQLDASCLVGTAVTVDPQGSGRFLRIVEQKDASVEERAIREVNMSTYVFAAEDLLRALSRLDNSNASGEYYLTDCPGILLGDGSLVDAVPCLDPSETLSVNTPEQLAEVAEALRRGGNAAPS